MLLLLLLLPLLLLLLLLVLLLLLLLLLLLPLLLVLLLLLLPLLLLPMPFFDTLMQPCNEDLKEIRRFRHNNCPIFHFTTSPPHKSFVSLLHPCRNSTRRSKREMSSQLFRVITQSSDPSTKFEIHLLTVHSIHKHLKHIVTLHHWSVTCQSVGEGIFFLCDAHN